MEPQVSPIGRNCSQAERDEFEKYDLEHKIRSTMVSKLETEFADYGLKYSIGGQVLSCVGCRLEAVRCGGVEVWGTKRRKGCIQVRAEGQCALGSATVV